MTGVGCLWGLRTKTMRVLVGCRMSIVGGGNRDLMRVGLDYRKVSGCEDREVDIVAAVVVVAVAAVGMVVVDRRMKTVEAHFEEGTAALGCESLSL